MDTRQRKLYVGIDVHHEEHKAAIVPVTLFETPGAVWRKVKPLSFKNSIFDFEPLDTAIRSRDVSIQVNINPYQCSMT